MVQCGDSQWECRQTAASHCNRSSIHKGYIIAMSLKVKCQIIKLFKYISRHLCPIPFCCKCRNVCFCTGNGATRNIVSGLLIRGPTKVLYDVTYSLSTGEKGPPIKLYPMTSEFKLELTCSQLHTNKVISHCRFIMSYFNVCVKL